MREILALLLATPLLLMMACGDYQDSDAAFVANAEDQVSDSAYIQMACDSLQTVKFIPHYIKNANDLARIKQEYNFANKQSLENKTLITLNRKEFRFFRVGDTIVLPEVKGKEVREYSIFPACYPQAVNIPKLIVLSNKYQCYGCYENGKLVRYAATNTGKERTQTYPGRYYINWKRKDHRSSLDSTWRMPYNINFHLQAGNAFHQFTMPGRPASHSCARQFMDDAEWLFSWVNMPKYDSSRTITQPGTLVLVLDVFDFNRKKFGPWLDLADNKSADITLPADPQNFEEPFIPIVQIPKGARGALTNRDRYVYAEDSLRARGWLREGVSLRESVNYNVIRKKRREAEAKKKAAEAAKANNNTQHQ